MGSTVACRAWRRRGSSGSNGGLAADHRGLVRRQRARRAVARAATDFGLRVQIRDRRPRIARGATDVEPRGSSSSGSRSPCFSPASRRRSTTPRRRQEDFLVLAATCTAVDRGRGARARGRGTSSTARPARGTSFVERRRRAVRPADGRARAPRAADRLPAVRGRGAHRRRASRPRPTRPHEAYAHRPALADRPTEPPAEL